MNSSDDEGVHPSAMEDKIHQMSLEIDSLKASRNYYKDQCESLLVSLSKTVNEQTPSYRTQQEVEETITNIKAQESEKNKRLKEKYKENERKLKEEIELLQATIKHHEDVIQKQRNTRTDLIEQLMSYKKQLTVTETRLRETEHSLEMKSSQDSSLLNSQDSSQLESLQTAQKNEVKKLKKQLLKVAKQLTETKNSMTLSQTIQEDTLHENEKLKQQINEQTQKIETLQKDNEDKTQQISDSKSLLINALHEAQLLENDVDSANQTIQVLLGKLKDNEEKFNAFNDEIVNKITEINQHKTVIQAGNETITNLQTKNEQLTQQITNLQQEITINKKSITETNENHQKEITELKQKIENYQRQEDSLNQKIKQQQLDFLAESRLRQAAEVAKEAAITNLKNAYALLNTSETTRNEYTAEIDKITTELDAKNQVLEENEKIISQLNNQVKETTNQLEEARAQISKLNNDYISVKDQFQQFQQHSILIDEAKKQIEAISNERNSAQNNIKQLEQENQSLTSELTDLKITLSHQESTIISLQNDIKSLSRSNKKLRSKFLKGEDASEDLLNTSRTIFNKSQMGLCPNCQELSKKIESMEHQNLEDAKAIEQLKVNLNSGLDSLHNLSMDIKKIVLEIPNAPQSLEELCDQLIQANSMKEACDLIHTLTVDFLEEIIRLRVVQTTNSTTETALLKSSISHLTDKIDTLKQKTQQQSTEINSLHTNMESVYTNREKYDEEIQALSRTLTSLRTQYEATKKKLAESEREKKKLKEELTLARIEQRKEEPQESSFSDSFDFSDISSVEEKNKPANAQSKRENPISSAAALGDSLAMLDLLCQ